MNSEIEQHTFCISTIKKLEWTINLRKIFSYYLIIYLTHTVKVSEKDEKETMKVGKRMRSSRKYLTNFSLVIAWRTKYE